MTFESKIVVGLGDIMAVIFECRKCQTRVSVKPERLHIPYKCPNCGEQWHSDFADSINSPKPAAERFCKALEQCRTVEENNSPFVILLEFEAES